MPKSRFFIIPPPQFYCIFRKYIPISFSEPNIGFSILVRGGHSDHFFQPLKSMGQIIKEFQAKSKFGQILLIFKHIFGPTRLQVRKGVSQYEKIFWALYEVQTTPKIFYRSVRSIVFEICGFKVQNIPKSAYFCRFWHFQA